MVNIYIYVQHVYITRMDHIERKIKKKREELDVNVYVRSSPSEKYDVTDKKREDVVKKEKYGGREKEIEGETERKRNSTSRNYYEIAKKLMIINKLLIV